MGLSLSTRNALQQAIDRRQTDVLERCLLPVRKWEPAQSLPVVIPLIKHAASLGWTEGLNALFPFVSGASATQHDVRRIVVLWALEHGHPEVAQAYRNPSPAGRDERASLLLEALRQGLFYAAESCGRRCPWVH